MKVGSLFAGIGGFDLAAERADMTVAWQSENDQKASAVLDHHWPDVPNLGDIHGINAPATVDVLTGGFPCQDYSVAGNREGLAGDRGALWWQYHRLITECRPTWVIGENVPGLLSSRNGADFQIIIDSLTKCGYGVVWAVFDAQYFGVAQRRRRVFIVAHSGGVPRPEILALEQGLYGHTPPGREAGPVPAALTANGLEGGSPDDNLTPASTFNWQSGGDVRLGIKEEHTDALHAGQVPAVVRTHNLHDEDKGDVWLSDIPGALQAVGPMPNQFDAVYQSSIVRRLTPLECERLQGFPDNWTDTPSNSDTQRYRQLGNAVAVPVVEWILRRLT